MAFTIIMCTVGVSIFTFRAYKERTRESLLLLAFAFVVALAYLSRAGVN